MFEASLLAEEKPLADEKPLAKEEPAAEKSGSLFAEEMEKARKQEQKDLEALEVLSTALHHLSESYVDQTATELSQLVEAALKGMVSSLDPHTTFLTKEQFDKLHHRTIGKYAGIGLVLAYDQLDRSLNIVSVIENSPADEAGIRKDDKIIAINGTSLKGLDFSDYPSMEGSHGTKIQLIIERNKQTKTYNLTYKLVEMKSVHAKILPPGIGYIRITSFQEETSEKVAEILSRQRASLAGLILDLRGNSGGLLEEAIAVSDQFIESGLLMSVMGRDSESVHRYFALKASTFSGFPMITLVDGDSASASEVLAGALQDHERAIIMGEKTFGKGSVQSLIPLPDGSGMKITIARYYTPSGRSIQAEGIVPDLILGSSEPEARVSRRREPLVKEGDLAGHIEKKEIQGFGGVKYPSVRGFDHYISKWDSQDQLDYQLKMAYIYLKAWLKLGLSQKSVSSYQGVSKSQKTKESAQ